MKAISHTGLHEPSAQTSSIYLKGPELWARTVSETSRARFSAVNHTNDTSVNCIHQAFEARVRETPDALAVTCEGRSLSYGELNRRANQLARYLRTLGVGPETLVGVYLQRSCEMIICLFGIMKAGGAYVPLDSNYPKERLAFM